LLTRHYEIFKSEANSEKDRAEILAEIAFVPPGTKEYRITDTRGGERAEGVVKKILEHEKKAAALQDAPTEITRDNYNFQLAGKEALDGNDCYVLELIPKRNESNLIKGKVWIDSDQFRIRQISGNLAKSPSLMVRRVSITIRYAEADGMWL